MDDLHRIGNMALSAESSLGLGWRDTGGYSRAFPRLLLNECMSSNDRRNEIQQRAPMALLMATVTNLNATKGDIVMHLPSGHIERRQR